MNGKNKKKSKTWGDELARLRREVAELREGRTGVGLLVENTEGDCPIERVELRIPPGSRVVWQLDPDDQSTVVVRFEEAS